MPFTTLISTTDLAQHLADPDWASIDCSFSLNDTERGRRAYQQAHIPGAIYAHLDEDLSGPIVRGQTGRHPLPALEAITATFSKWGVDSKTQVVAYDDAGGAIAAARVWWLLRWLGHANVAVLDGGWQHWLRENRPTHSGVEHRAARTFRPQPQPEWIVTAQDVLEMTHDPRARVVDVRNADRYRGENEIIDPIAGHIPGALSAPYAGNLDADGKFLTAGQLRAKYKSLLGQVAIDHTAFYCGSGVTAAHSVLAVAHAGLGQTRLYAGSWSEWILDPTRPIKTGSE